MNSSFFSTVGSVLLLLLLVLAVLALLAFFLRRYWKKEISENLKTASLAMRQLGSENKRLHVSIQDYPDSPPAPYGSLVILLRSQLVESDELIQNLTLQYSDYQQSVRSLNQRDWKSIIISPIRMYRLHRYVKGLISRLPSIENSLKSSSSIKDQIEDQAWVLAGLVRQVQAKLIRFDRLSEFFKEKQVDGENLEAAIRTKNQIDIAMAAIPEFYFAGERGAVLSQADRDSIINGNQVLTTWQPAIDDLVSQAETWDKQYRETAENLSTLKTLTVKLRASLDSQPSSMVLSDLGTLIDRSILLSSDVSNRFKSIDVDDIPDLNQKTTDILKDVQTTLENLKTIKDQHASLSQLLPEIKDNRNALITNLDQFSTKTAYPLIWNKSQVQFNDLNHRIESLGQSDKPRTPTQLEKDLILARTLHNRLKELDNQYQAAVSQYQSVVAILNSLNLPDILVKSQSSHQLANKLAEYNPENWSRQDGILDFRVDLENFLANLKVVVPESASISVKETELSQLVDQVVALSEQLKLLREREERIKLRFAELQDLETNAEESIRITQTALNQIVLLSNTNPVLKEIVSGELEHILYTLEQSHVDLINHQQGLVPKKCQKINETVNRIEQSCNQWLNRFNSDVRVKKDLISEKVRKLKVIADFSEPAIADAEKILLSKGAGIEDTLLKTNRIPLSDIVVHFRNLNEIWQRSLAVSRSIEEIETPVYEINDKAEQMRENARARLLEASRWTESQKNWPPISVSINDVQRDFEEVDQQRETIRKAQPRALWLVGRLGDISSRYQSIAERARRFSERAEADQNHIHDLEKQIDEAVNLWQFQKNAYSSNTMATANIHRLLGDITQNLEFLKQQSRQGKKGYGQIEQELAFLSAKATNATIPIELDQKIDINGEIRMERNAK